MCNDGSFIRDSTDICIFKALICCLISPSMAFGARRRDVTGFQSCCRKQCGLQMTLGKTLSLIYHKAFKNNWNIYDIMTTEVDFWGILFLIISFVVPRPVNDFMVLVK